MASTDSNTALKRAYFERCSWFLIFIWFGAFTVNYSIYNISTETIPHWKPALAASSFGFVGAQLIAIEFETMQDTMYYFLLGAVAGYGWVVLVVNEPRGDDFVLGIMWSLVIMQTAHVVVLRLYFEDKEYREAARVKNMIEARQSLEGANKVDLAELWKAFGVER